MLPMLPFGKTGHKSSRIIFGAAALSAVTQPEADRAIELLLETGVNHIDTAASYGESELRLGPWMATHRGQFFLATKTGERSFQEAYDQIKRSLDRLRVDQIDLIQLHNLVDESEWEVAMGAGGALEAASRARQEGLVRFIGVTGHGLSVAAMHRRSLERFPFDSVLLPLNFEMMRNPAYAADFEALYSICRERDIAIQTIKSITQAPWGERPQTTATWYEPLQTQADIDLAVHWVLGRDGTFVNTAGDVALLPLVIDSGSRFETAPSDEQMEQLSRERAMAPLFA